MTDLGFNRCIFGPEFSGCDKFTVYFDVGSIGFDYNVAWIFGDKDTMHKYMTGLWVKGNGRVGSDDKWKEINDVNVLDKQEIIHQKQT